MCACARVFGARLRLGVFFRERERAAQQKNKTDGLNVRVWEVSGELRERRTGDRERIRAATRGGGSRSLSCLSRWLGAAAAAEAAAPE